MRNELEGILKDILTVAVPVLHLAGYVAYNVKMMQGQSKPHPWMWLILLFMAIANAASYVAVASFDVAPQYIAGIAATGITMVLSGAQELRGRLGPRLDGVVRKYIMFTWIGLLVLTFLLVPAAIVFGGGYIVWGG